MGIEYKKHLAELSPEKLEFVSWLRLQKNSKNSPYSDGAIDIVVRTFENCLSSMKIDNVPYLDLFEYKNLEDFMPIYSTIINHPLYQAKAQQGGNFYTEHARHVELYKKYLMKK